MRLDLDEFMAIGGDEIPLSLEDEVRPGARLYEVGRAIQSHAEAAGFGVVRSFVGHGVGEEFHTAPAGQVGSVLRTLRT